jgi:integrase
MKAKKPLTDRAIRGLKPAPPGKRRLAWDAQVPGLAVRVTDTGAKSFVLVVRYPGQRHPSPRALGTYGAITLEAARARARESLALLSQGIDPKSHEAARRADTFRAICEAYLEREGARLRTVADRRMALKRLVYPRIGSQPIDAVRRSDINRILDQIEDQNGPVMADRVLAYIRKVMNWHASRSDEFRSPIVRGMARTRPKERMRTRALDDQEIRDLWEALDVAKVPACYPAFVRTLLLTGQRLREVSRMRREEIEEAIWVIPAAKTKIKIQHAVPLSKSVKELLPERKSGFVFSSDGGKRSFSGFSKSKAALVAAIDELRKRDGRTPMPRWGHHDLRRTARSLMPRAGVSNDIAERVLGHTLGPVRATYDKYAYAAEKLEALERLAAQVNRILDPQKNVVTLPRKKS